MSDKYEIVHSQDLSTYKHLGDFQTCSHCGFNQKFKEWEKLAIKLVLAKIQGKHGSGVIIMECSKCFKFVWVHHPLPLNKYRENKWPEGWIEASEKEYTRREILSLREWENKQCLTCSKIKEVYATTHAWRRCDIGSGPPESKCNVYKSTAKPNKRSQGVKDGTN